jgi:hypothetical protein
MTSLQKLIMPLSLPALLIGLWAIVSCIAAVIAQRNRRRAGAGYRLLLTTTTNDDNNVIVDDATQSQTRQQLSYRVCASLVTLLDFSLFIVVGVSVSLLHRVHIERRHRILKTPCRLWAAGDQPSARASITAFGSTAAERGDRDTGRAAPVAALSTRVGARRRRCRRLSIGNVAQRQALWVRGDGAASALIAHRQCRL